MPITIRDTHLEEQIDAERQRRQDATMAKTLSDLAREMLTRLEMERRDERADARSPAPAPATA